MATSSVLNFSSCSMVTVPCENKTNYRFELEVEQLVQLASGILSSKTIKQYFVDSLVH